MTPKKAASPEPDATSSHGALSVGSPAPAAIINANLSTGGPHLVDDEGNLTKEGASAASLLP